MASITLTGTLLDPTGEVAVGDQIRFTHRTTTGETIQFARSVLIIPPNGLYNITLEFGLIFVEYLDIKDVNYKSLGVVTVNQDSTATDLPGLLNAIVPPTGAQLLLFQGILADTEDARDIALLAAAQQTTLELIASTTTHPNSTVLTLSGHTLPGDGGGGKWQLNGVVGQTPSQSPTQLTDFLLNDGNGNQWALVDGVVLAFNGVQYLPLPFGATGNGNYAYNNNDFDKIVDPDRLNPATLAAWQDDTSAQLDDVVTTKERSAGNGGGATGDVIASGTEDGFSIVKHNTLSLSWEIRKDDVMNAAMFGVLKTGDQTSAWQAFFVYLKDNAVKGLGIKDGDHDATSTLVNFKEGVEFDGLDCNFNKLFDGRIFNFENPLTNTQSATLSVVSVDLDGGTSVSDSTCELVSISDTSGYALNDVVKIFSDDIILGEDPANNNFKGEYGVVALINPNVSLTLYSTLRSIFTTNIRVARLVSEEKLKLSNFTIDGTGFAVGWAKPTISIIGYKDPIIKNISGENLPAAFLRLISCYRPKTYDVSGKNIRTSSANNAFGYVIHESSVFAGRHYNPSGENCRHVYTCSAREGSANGAQDYGDTYQTRVFGGNGQSNQAASFDTHPDAEDVRFIGCTAINPFFGVNGNFNNYGFRGRNCGADDCTSIGGRGFRAFSDFASNDNSRGHTLNGCSHRFLKDETNDSSGFSILGQVGANVTMTVNNPKIIGAQVDNASFECDFGVMHITDIDIENRVSGSGSARVFEANEEGQIYCDGGLIDSAAATGTDLRLSKITDNTGVIEVKNLKLAGGDFEALVDLLTNDGLFFSKNINLTDGATMSPTAGFLNAGASAVVGIDYIEDEGRSGTRAQGDSLLINAGSGFALDLEFRSANRLRMPVVASVAGGSISSVTAGSFTGQKMTITSKAASTETFDIINGGNFSVGSNITVAIASAHNFWWDGFDWVND